MQLFDFIDCLFSKEKWKTVSEVDKRSNFFMVQRFLSIQFPLECNVFNDNGISKEKALDYWNIVLCNRYRSKPSWIFTKQNPLKNIKDKSFDKIEKETISYYLEKYFLKMRDFEFLKKYFLEELLVELEAIQKCLKNQ